MKIHEYQAKELLRKYGIPVPAGRVAGTADEAVAAAEALETFPVAVKAQIHAGGRGKGGGIRLAQTLAEVRERANEILGMTLVTPQTGPAGKMVRKILIEQAVDSGRELYVSLLVDREAEKIALVASGAGGMDIEAVAAESPRQISKVMIDPLVGIKPYHCREIAFGLDIGATAAKLLFPLLTDLYRLFVSCDCSLVEINPLLLTATDSFMALDAKVEFDNNALFRHPELAGLRDSDEEDPLEVEAARHSLNYINLDGTIGNMVNGAGLAMATMDIIKAAGAEPANFLDVGGGASAEMVANGFRIILSDKKVKGILVNIFGGILRCDVLAQGIVQAAREVAVNVPVVVRMEGTNVEEGRRILAESGLALTTAVDLKDAARKMARIAAA